MTLKNFRRREYKYLITTAQYAELIQCLSPYFRPDRYGIDGKYTVTTLYFESKDYKIYEETKSKLPIRQKLRLRVYDDADLDGDAFFEVKQKRAGVVHKKRIVLPLREAYRYLADESPNSLADGGGMDLQVLNEIDNYRKSYNLHPEVVISYERHAFHHVEDASLRVTFDTNLRCRNQDLAIENGADGKRFIDPDLVVLEVKSNESLPKWLLDILEGLACEKRSASKFCTSLELLKGDVLPVEFGKNRYKGLGGH